MSAEQEGHDTSTPPNESEEVSGVLSTSHGSQSFDLNRSGQTSALPNKVPRTALSEFSKVPLLIDVTNQILLIHGTISSQCPLYSCLTSVVLQTAFWLQKRAEHFVLFLWIAECGDCVLLGILDFMKGNIPQIYLPSQELFEKLYMYLKKQVMVTTAYVASFGVSQKMCRIVENGLKILEKVFQKFTLDKDMESQPFWFTPNMILVVYESTVNRILLTGVCHIRQCRLAARSMRRAGSYIIARDLKIQSRRKMSPRKSLKPKPSTGRRCLIWIKNTLLELLGISYKVPPPRLVIGSYPPNSPNKQIPSAEKKRKLSAVEEENTCSSEEEEESMTHYMLCTLTSYTSGEDPDFVPGDFTTSSSDFDISDVDDDELESSLESYKEYELVTKGKRVRKGLGKAIHGGNSDPQHLDAKTPVNGGKPEDSIEKNGNTTDKSDIDSIRSREGAKSTSSPESRRRGLLRW